MHAKRAWLARGYVRALVVALACAAVVGCAPKNEMEFELLETVAYETEPWNYRDREARVLKTEHYRIFTTLEDERLLAMLPQMMESAFAYYRHLVPTALGGAEPMDVYLFAKRGEWVDFTRRFTGPRARKFLQLRRGGYSLRGVTVIEYGGYQATFPIMVHEGLHQYLGHLVEGRVPAWLNEGLAAYCEGQRWGGVGLEGFDPWHNPMRRNALAEALVRDELFPLPELLRMDAGHVVGGPNRKIATYYAQVWAMMLFLQEGVEGKYAEGFERMLKGLGAGALDLHTQAAEVRSMGGGLNFGEGVFRSFISDDLEACQSEFEEFIREKVIGGRGHTVPLF